MPHRVTPFADSSLHSEQVWLRASSEPIRFAQGQLREGSVALGLEVLSAAKHDSRGRQAASTGCHPERSEGSRQHRP
jgi:hypothetical protein